MNNTKCITTLAASIGLFAGTAVQATVHDLSTATGPLAPDFRGNANTTYFGWETGTWDGNADPGADTLNPTPSINPASGASITQNNSIDIVSGSNNIYTGPSSIDLSLVIPTDGTPGTGFTTIIAQGVGLTGFGGQMAGFSFGDIAGVSPEYVITSAAESGNADGETQFWAKWQIPGNQSSYTVAVGSSGPAIIVPGYPISITDLVVDTVWSPDGYAIDTAVPEPASLGLAALGMTMLARRRR